MAELTLEQQRAVAVAQARRARAEAESKPVFSGTILPFSKMKDGSVEFDSNAGIVGAIKRAFTLPGEVYRGEVQLNDPQTGLPTDETVGRALESAMFMSPVTPSLRSGSKLVPGVTRNLKKQKVEVPTADELLKAGSDGFDAMRATGAEFPSSEVKGLAETLMARMNEKGFDENTAKNTFRTLRKLADPPNDSVATIGNLHSARKTFGKIGQNFNDPSDQTAARTAINAIDEFIVGTGSGVPAAGPVAGIQRRAGEALQQANANFAAGNRSKLLDDILDQSELAAAAANSGQNLGNAIRSQVKSTLKQPKKVAGFNASEIQALRELVQGSRLANSTRSASNVLGGGGGLGMLAAGGLGGATGAFVGGPIGAGIGSVAAAAPGVGLKALSNKLTRNALNSADKAVRMRSPLFEQRVQQSPFLPVRDQSAEALIRALLLGTGNAQ